MTYEELLKENEKLQKELSNTKIVLANKELELNNLKRIVFGSKREKAPEENNLENSEQCSIFDNEKDIEKNVQEQIEKQIEEIIVYKKKKSKKKNSGIKKRVLKDIVVKRREYVLDENEKCPKCEGDLTLVGKKILRQEVDYKPAIIELVEYVQYIYKCKKCGTKEREKETSTFVKSEVPKPILTHSFASPSLAAEVIYQKYYLGVPLYRQEKMWDDKGLVMPRNMMANWNIKITEYYFNSVYELMSKEL